MEKKLVHVVLKSWFQYLAKLDYTGQKRKAVKSVSFCGKFQITWLKPFKKLVEQNIWAGRETKNTTLYALILCI